MFAVMAVVNRQYYMPLKKMMASLFRTNPYPIDFYLFHEELSEDEIRELEDFVLQWEDKTLHPVEMSSEMLEGLPVTKEFPKEIYFKLLGLDLLPEDLHKILCMDLDIIVKGDISALFSVPVENAGIAACHDVFSHYYGFEDNNLDCLGLSHRPPYFNAGVMLFSLDFIRKIGGGKAIISLAHLHKDKLYYPEQDILNVIFHDSYIELPWHLYNCPPLYYIMSGEEVKKGTFLPLPYLEITNDSIPEGYLDYTQSVYETAAIIHYMGGTKPWKADREPSAVYDLFDRAYNE